MFTRHGLGFYAQRHAPADAVRARPKRVFGKAAGGFTLIEVMITVLIVAILAAIAIPVISSTTPVQEANSLLGALQLARSVAVKQGQAVVVCPATVASGATLSAITCTASATSWSGGWIVLSPGSLGNCAAAGGATGDTVLQAQNTFTNKDTASYTANGANTSNNTFCFNPFGFSPAGNAGIVQFDSSPIKLSSRRCVAVTGVGHIQLLKAGQTDSLGAATCPAT